MLFRSVTGVQTCALDLHWAQRFQAQDVLKELASYLKPGTFQLMPQPDVTDRLGRSVDALVLVPLQPSGGMTFEGAESRRSMDATASE